AAAAPPPAVAPPAPTSQTSVEETAATPDTPYSNPKSGRATVAQVLPSQWRTKGCSGPLASPAGWKDPPTAQMSAPETTEMASSRFVNIDGWTFGLGTWLQVQARGPAVA